ncbi:MAG: hypothetical protein K9W46_12190 [Candidatus Heimdallarchaeum endolithica]|uniref:Uncharacterized protein n=1 Tax=Candidatus Heimdallarchaeum endolithica TaxID=2876572 RepID=A0A9Y1FN62_9ARCH|nr:MAG: hypothetical protein K9W46_12190 [Candidatus Heimdallarchaeum endolithica]
MPVSQSLKEMFDFQKAKKIKRDLIKINENLQIIYLSLIIFSRFKARKLSNHLFNSFSSENIENAIILVNNEQDRNKVGKEVSRLRNYLDKLAFNASYEGINVLKKWLAFYKLAESMKLSKNILLFAQKQILIIKELLEIFEKLIVFKNINDVTNKKNLEAVINNLSTKIDVYSLEIGNPLHKFLKIYYHKTIKGESVSLADITEFAVTLSKSDIGDKIFLQILDL